VTSPSRRVLGPVVQAAWSWLDRVGEIVPGTRSARRFGSFGEGSAIGFPVATVMNPSAIHIGRDTLIGRQVTLSVGYGVGDPGMPARGLVIGDRCIIGARCTLTAHESIEVGDGVWFGQDVFVSDAGHGYQDPDVPIGEQFGSHDPVVIGPGSWIGHGAILLQGTRLGRNVVVAAGSVVRGDVPDHAVVAGTPARVVRRYEPGIGWVGRTGDVRPVVRADYLQGALTELRNGA
jgi:acetyltransferase-like isoleucine patch superfamily enzyme